MLKTFVGTLAGLVAGVAIGLFTAPAKGSETRQRFADSASSMKKLRGIANKTMDERWVKGASWNWNERFKSADVKDHVLCADRNKQATK